MGFVGRANNLALRGAGLGNSGDVGFAVFAAKVNEVGDVLLPFTWPLPVAGVLNVEVGLDQDGGCGGTTESKIPASEPENVRFPRMKLPAARALTATNTKLIPYTPVHGAS